MKADFAMLNDPEPKTWDSPFQSDRIHGLLKVAGESKAGVQAKLDAIKSVFGDTIRDVLGQEGLSRLDGHVRPGELKGMEQ